MYSELKFKSVDLYKNTQYGQLHKDHTLRKETLNKLSSFFDMTDTISFFNYKRKELISVIIPEHKTTYADKLFDSCASLEKIILSKNTKMLSEWMFFGCTKLKNISLPDTLTEIHKFAFAGCSNLEKIDLPDNISYIGLYAFCNCKNLKYITFKGKKYTNPDEFNKMLNDNGYTVFTEKTDSVW